MRSASANGFRASRCTRQTATCARARRRARFASRQPTAPSCALRARGRPATCEPRRSRADSRTRGCTRTAPAAGLCRWRPWIRTGPDQALHTSRRAAASQSGGGRVHPRSAETSRDEFSRRAAAASLGGRVRDARVAVPRVCVCAASGRQPDRGGHVACRALGGAGWLESRRGAAEARGEDEPRVEGAPLLAQRARTSHAAAREARRGRPAARAALLRRASPSGGRRRLCTARLVRRAVPDRRRCRRRLPCAGDGVAPRPAARAEREGARGRDEALPQAAGRARAAAAQAPR
mmetsp:Transcript_4696/g.15722  ORF Transcript_4696/g.15722 Transcript_4696/m.15722 type:complete len:292 (+) Transcript_4696:618-1493(+)